MFRTFIGILLCSFLLAIPICDSSKLLKYNKLELLKEIVGRYFSDITDVRPPPQPKVSFAVRLTKVLSNVNAMVIVFESVLTNEGNGYDNTSGTFTAPLRGMYLFSWHVLSHSGKQARVYLYVNNKETWLSYADDGPQGNDTGSATVILRLRRGDKVQLRTAEKGNCLHSGFTTFTGTLLYR